jgi:hypothetical protein
LKQIQGLSGAVETPRELVTDELVDASTQGISFQLPEDNPKAAQFATGASLIFRLYINKDSFIALLVHVKNVSIITEDGKKYVRPGCHIDPQAQDYETYSAFLTFLSKYVDTARTDQGFLKFFAF